MKILTLVVALLAGCASVSTTSPRTVVIRAAGGMPVALPAAEKECAKHNRHARFTAYGITKFEHVFDCVE